MNSENKAVDLSELKVADLNEIIDLYATAGVVPAEGTDLSLKADKVKWLEEQRATVGEPHQAEDGTVTLVPITAETDATPAGVVPAEQASTPETDPTPAAPVAPATSPRLIYRGKTVLSHHNKLLNGKLYVEVFIEGESFVIPQGEFNSDVKPARSND